MPQRVVDDAFILELINKHSATTIVDLSQEAAFQPLVQLLQSDNIDEPNYEEAIHGQVARKLSAFGSRAVAPLVSYLLSAEHQDKNFGEMVARNALMGVAFGSAGNDDRTYSRAKVAQELGKLGDKQALPALVETLQNTRMWYLLTFVAEAIHSLADFSVIDSLLDILLHHENEGNRKFAAVAIGGISHPKTIEALILALKDDSADVAVSAAQSLGRLRAEPAINPLKEATKDERQHSGERGGEIRVCQAAIGALKSIDTLEARENWVNWCLETLQNNPDPELRYSAAYDLDIENDYRVVPVLIKALLDDGMTGHPSWEPVSKAAQGTLEKIASKEAVDALVTHNIQLLKDGQTRQRIDAIFRLGKHEDKRAILALIEALSDDTPQPHSKRTVSYYAYVALEKLNSAEAIEAINKWKSGKQ